MSATEKPGIVSAMIATSAPQIFLHLYPSAIAIAPIVPPGTMRASPHMAINSVSSTIFKFFTNCSRKEERTPSPPPKALPVFKNALKIVL